MSTVTRREVSQRQFGADCTLLAECIAGAISEVQVDSMTALVALEMVARSIRSATERALLVEDGAFAEFEQQLAAHFNRLKEKPRAGAS